MALKFRRGTTAQKSGSLAFGEPYVNTTLGTLQIGLDTGDVTLSAIGTGTNLSVAGISGSSLDITGNAKIDGNLSLGGAITIGDATSDTVNVVAALSSSLIPQTTNAFDLGSADKIWRDLYISTGSIKFVEGTTVVKTLNANTLNALEAATGSANASVAALNSFSSSQLTQNTALATITGSLIDSASAAKSTNDTQDGRLISLESVSGSQLTQNTALATVTGSLITSASTAKSTNDTQDGRLTNIESFSGSQLTQNIELATVTGSLILSASNANGRLAAIEAVSGTFARTNSTNTFNGNQTVSGSLTVTQDFIVLGSSSIQNVSSSTLNIGTNLITVAVNQPSVRFGGFAVVDSGSSGGSGSFLYDSVEDEFIFVHKGNGTNVTSSHFLLGPETYDNLGNETYLTNNKLPKGTGKEHLNDSNITDTGTLITLGSNAVVNGTFYATGATLVSGSSQIDLTATTNYASGILTRLNAVGVVSGSSQVDVASTTGDIALGTRTSGNYVASLVAGTNITLSNNSGEGATPTIGLTNNTISGVSLGSNLAALTIGTGLSGTSYNGSGAVTIANTGVTSNVAGTGIGVSGATGAVTITNTGVTAITAGTGVSRDTSTGNVTISIGQSVATNATPTFGNLTINGTITATGDITAFFTSDRRHKNSIQTISNAVLKVKQLNGVTWEWNDDVSEVTKSTPKTGLIAQEVQQVLPQVVIERNDGFLALDYSKMVGLLVEAIKEQQIQIDQLKAQIGSK
jgi:hypothetical protein